MILSAPSMTLSAQQEVELKRRLYFVDKECVVDCGQVGTLHESELYLVFGKRREQQHRDAISLTNVMPSFTW